MTDGAGHLEAVAVAVVVVLTVSILAAGPAPALATVDAGPDAPPGLIITTDASASAARTVRGATTALGTATTVTPLADDVSLVTGTATALREIRRTLQADPAVVAIEPDVRREWAAAPDDPSYPLQWAHRQTRADAGWAITTGTGPTSPLIAIIDSGIDPTHPELANAITSRLRVVDGEVEPVPPGEMPCADGHGTAVAGVAAARGDDGRGIAGVAWAARVIDVALVSPADGCPAGPLDSDSIAAIDAVARMADRPDVINLSFAGPQTTCPAGLQAAIDAARAADIAVVAAAGNGRSTATAVPASCDGVISVAATTAAGARAGYSQRNPQVDIAAPGGDQVRATLTCPTFEQVMGEMILTTSLTQSTELVADCPPYEDPRGDRLRGISGTSFSSSYVAGVIGLMRRLAAEQGDPLSLDEAEAILQTTAQDRGAPGLDCAFGFGIVDVGAALSAVQAGDRPALQAVPPIGSGACAADGATIHTAGGGDVAIADGTSCGAPVEGGDVVRRIADSSSDDPVCQAIAVSSRIPGGAAPYAVLARTDDFADALAGSAVSLGLGPLLFTSRDGPLDASTEAEIVRVVDPDGDRRVYIMGGTAAVPATVDDRLRQLDLVPVRLAGDGREATAVAASREVRALTAEAAFPTRDAAFIAFGRNWPDAVGAGQMAAHYGIPILVTNTDSLHPAAEAELIRLDPADVYVLGGTAVISDDVVQDIRALGLEVTRLGGAGRVDTLFAVSDLFDAELQADEAAGAAPPRIPVLVNTDASFGDLLTASLIGGQGNPYVPLAGDGTVVPAGIAERYCGLGGPLFVVGGTARIPDSSVDRVVDVLDGRSC